MRLQRRGSRFLAITSPHTGIIIAGLGSPEVLVEVEVTAYLPWKCG